MPEIVLRSEYIQRGIFRFKLANIGSPALNITFNPILLRVGGMTQYRWIFSPVEYCTQGTPVDLRYVLVGRRVGVLSAEASHQDLRVIAECDPFGEMFDNEVTPGEFKDTGAYPYAKIPLTIECEDQFGNTEKFSFTMEYDRVKETIFCRRVKRTEKN